MDIIRPDSGTVRVFGEPRRREHLDRLGYLPEERGLYTKLTVGDVMTYFGTLKGLSRSEARRRALEWLENVELPHVSSWRVDRLSKGMSQKVQIASVLLSDPELCVLDEPTTGLDPVNVRLVQDLLLERRRAGRTTILSTHHMNQVEALCDRVAMINQGQLMVYGAVDDVRREHSLPEVAVHARGRCPRSRRQLRSSPSAMAPGASRSPTASARPACSRRWSAPARSSIASSRCSRRWRTSSFASCGRDSHDPLAQGEDRGHVRVHGHRQAAGVRRGHVRHAAVHGRLRGGRRRPCLLRVPARPRHVRLRGGRSAAAAEAARGHDTTAGGARQRHAEAGRGGAAVGRRRSHAAAVQFHLPPDGDRGRGARSRGEADHQGLLPDHRRLPQDRDGRGVHLG